MRIGKICFSSYKRQHLVRKFSVVPFKNYFADFVGKMGDGAPHNL